MLSVGLFFISVALFATLQYLIENRNYWQKRNVPEVKGVIGNFMKGKKSLPEIYREIYYAHPNDDNIGVYYGTKPALIIKNLKNIQAVLASDYSSFFTRGFIRNRNDLLSDNILHMEDYERWRLIRSKISPVFTTVKLKNMFYIMDRCAEDFIKYIGNNKEALENPFNSLYTYTTASIAASVFGIETNKKNTMDSPLIDMAWKAAGTTPLKILKFTISVYFPKLFELLKLNMFIEQEDYFINVVKAALQDRRISNNKRYDFIDTCLELQNEGMMQNPTSGYKLEPTDELMAAQAFFFFIAGADTSAHSMHFTLLELAGNPEILKRLHEEIDEVFEKYNEKITYNEMEEFKYMDMVINEAIRKHPPVGYVQRKCSKPTTLPFGDINIEKNVTVIIPIYAIHRDEKYYPNPDVYDPERFSPNNISKIPKFAYLPFGEGNRICIGARFARLQLKIGLARLLRRYTLKQQMYKPGYLPSIFGLRDPKALIDFLPRQK